MKIKVLSSVHVEADLDRATYRPKNNEDYAKQLESAVRDFHDFVRDHRSMDWVTLNVVRQHEDQCSHCGYLWEVDAEGMPVCCEKAIVEFELEQSK
jgi:hypothetical protein